MTKTRSGSEKTLGQILIAKGIISQKQLDLALKIKTVHVAFQRKVDRWGDKTGDGFRL